MGPATCPTCSGSVEPADETCPNCGSGLAPGLGFDADAPATIAAELEFLPGQVFAERFTIIEKTGSGGMGVVYKAIDTALDSPVALKLIQPILAETPVFAERFRREVRLTRQITHANICRVHDIGEYDGVLYLSMQWIDGETLQQLLRKTGMLNESRALQIARKIAMALDAAHAQKIVHRDLKPGNVMIDRTGKIYVLDFGLAVEQDSDLTGSGVVQGTPLYMAPEQRRLEKLDGRADLYALGLILREMLTGRRVVPDPSLSAEVRNEVNPLIAPIVGKLLAEKRDERYAAARDALLALGTLLDDPAITATTLASQVTWAERSESRARRKWWAAGALALGVTAALAYYFSDREPATPPLSQEAQGFYDAGVRYLRDESESLPTLSEAIKFFHRAQDRAPDSALVLAALCEAYWRRYRMNPESLPKQEAEQACLEAMRIDPDLAEVHNARGLGFGADGQHEAARGQFEKAVEKQPGFAAAWANLGATYAELGDYAAGREAFRKALDLAPGSFLIHVRAGLFYWDFDETEESIRHAVKATELKPDSLSAWNNLAAAYLDTGQYDQALEPLSQSLELEENSELRSNLGTLHYMLGQYEEAVRHYRIAAGETPTNPALMGNLGDALVKLGRLDEAHEAYVQAVARAEKIVALKPLDPGPRSALGLYCAKAGMANCALKNGIEALDAQPDSASYLVNMATIACLLGRDSDALDWLDKAIKHGATQADIDNTPEFERLAGLERFREIAASAP